MTDKMERADKIDDSSTVFKVVKVISGLLTATSQTAPTKDKDGNIILDHEKLTAVWQDFLAGKFKETTAEAERDDFEELGPQLVLTEQAFVRALQRLKKGKACGPDGIPGEVFTSCESAARELFRILQMIWSQEYVPPALVRAAFIMLYKNKGSVDNPAMYRCIGLLPHAYKILSLVMLERIMSQCSDYLSDWKAGFRPESDCRDNILLLRLLFDHVLEVDKALDVLFIDYSAAFDSIIHKFLDVSLKAAGASRKTRTMFRAIYRAAEGTARVRGLDGKHVYSESFQVRRGVIQGDIISPIFFILAMEQIFKMHDPSPDGIALDNYLRLSTLGYADDAALLSTNAKITSQRLNKVARGSSKDADVNVHMGKTKNMHVRKQDHVAPSTVTEIKSTEDKYKHVCKFCDRRFKTCRGMKIHEAACNNWHGLTPDVFQIEKITRHLGLR